MFFGPAHSFTQYSSLPRRTTAAGSAFQRNAPIRRSTGIPEHHIEYFVPRSVSEFNLSGVGDLALPPPRRCSPTIQQTNLGGLHHGIQLGPPQTLICTSAPPPVQIMMKPREKMVTFEDESKAHTNNGVNENSMGAGVGMGMGVSVGVSTTHCPHGVPTTPRKSGGVLGGPSVSGASNMGGDVFM